ncbi:histidine kinase [Cesiribacter andamanensis]|uniref:Signal transduction histidine kinase internal region domain-containing protein n=1 Tax=Cesiribacter andamanensis AMV16 TaxID=1279009 RepID=M7NTP5_9BACT|nr:histidine kinase [Cesiribacter andamanensis]EMR01834.1 hypothetical protein ADICEAN_03030 [Cesiribacter andamanensis AMV16]
MYSTPATRPLFRLLAPLGFGAMVYLLVLLAFDTHSRVLSDFFNQELLVCIGISYGVLEANRLLAVSLTRRAGQFWLWSSLKLLLALLATALITSLALILYFRYQLNFTNPLSFLSELKVFNSIFGALALLYQGYFLGFVALHHQYQLRIAEEEARALELQQQIDLFRHALHPDFLFAGLEHVILRLRELQHQQADAGISLLARLYQYFLRRQEELIPLQEELEAVHKLHQLLLHSGRHLQLQLGELDEQLLLIPGSLLRLLEAIAHGQLSSAAAPLLVRIEQVSGSLHICFEPNFSLSQPGLLERSLQNLEQRYTGLTGERLRWTPGTPYQITLPTASLHPHESYHH